MKALVWVALALVVGCKSGSKAKEAATAGSAAATAKAVNVPTVSVATVLAADDKQPPPFLVIVDDAGGTHVNWASKWADIATNDLKKGAKTAPLDVIERLTSDAYMANKRPKEAIAWWDSPDYSKFAAIDAPPPPEEEDKPDDGEDESGGTGTAMALEEGKMGKKDSDRSAGAYQMKKVEDDPMLMGYRGPAISLQPQKPDPLGDPTRLVRTAAEVMTDGKLPDQIVVIVASPRAKAQKVIDAMTELEASLAVAHGGTVRPLRLNLMRDPRREGEWGTIGTGYFTWLEARVSNKGITIEAPPAEAIEIAWANGAIDGAELAAALDKARKSREASAIAPVDILVDADVDAQRLVDVAVALDVAGVRMIGFGNAPNADEAARRGKRNPTVRVAQPVAKGDLDKSEIRRVVREAHPKLVACYTAALAKDPKISGTIMTEFFISPKGTVTSADASGVDAELSKCIAGVVKTLVFPKPSGGGGVQVTYPFTLRP